LFYFFLVSLGQCRLQDGKSLFDCGKKLRSLALFLQFDLSPVRYVFFKIFDSIFVAFKFIADGLDSCVDLFLVFAPQNVREKTEDDRKTKVVCGPPNQFRFYFGECLGPAHFVSMLRIFLLTVKNKLCADVKAVAMHPVSTIRHHRQKR